MQFQIGQTWIRWDDKEEFTITSIEKGIVFCGKITLLNSNKATHIESMRHCFTLKSKG